MTAEKPARVVMAAFGVLAAALALGSAELTAALIGRPEAGPLPAVGSVFIDLSPAWLKDFAIRTFGAQDKLVLLVGLAAVIVIAAAAIGIAAPRRPYLAIAALTGLAAVAGAAALSRPGSRPADVLPAVVGAAGGAFALLRTRRLSQPGPETDDPARRVLLTRGAAMLGLAVLSGGTGRAIVSARRSSADGRALVLPRPADPAGTLPAGVELNVPGLGPFTTPNRAFYRVDTALVIPRVPYQEWTLRVHGMVDRPVELSFADVLARPLTERDITLTCVSNEVGGPYAGHARWLGVDLAALLRETGIRAEADQILSRSADGWTASTALESVLDGRDALLAIAMNGQPLSPAHGFPARMVVPGLYGYVSATKWVVDLKLTRFADERAYWTRRGWAERAPIKTASRIEVPKPFAEIPAGPVTVAGTAWAQHRGVAAVEVRVDGGPWRQADLAASAGPDTWRQWRTTWQATPGQHRIEVRATDATGHTQPAERVPPIPDGATGWHTVLVTVT
ncbi:molybdopterin-dependent oxidoreductase [Streptosporangium saharense]|uniref:DMSO/TMAO reductase YedYZ molybdopterin-dependent catalytic subunit n=1 Tax=Streptosporangium saharense TaxID=1706840 RepID=A0A7W7QPK5_9ACTN|nr:molybdopterin-dependent oxidoreductase [Streptosporangium saharense]MBB4917303.1 DMSO/TMAO reductase YedYZ molybdopterin-dependent catalytic subunit [Streptosporangium saharense]